MVLDLPSVSYVSSRGIIVASSSSMADALSLGSSLQLIIQKLNERNIIEWAQSMKLALNL